MTRNPRFPSPFTKAVTNVREGYAGVDGDVNFGNMDAKAAKKYPGQIIFNQEDDTHFPSLTVAQTLKFGLKMKTPSSRPEGVSREEFEAAYLDTILKTLGIPHTADTLVGNEFVRGVSGGERKRVSIAEVLVNRSYICLSCLVLNRVLTRLTFQSRRSERRRLGQRLARSRRLDRARVRPFRQDHDRHSRHDLVHLALPGTLLRLSLSVLPCPV